MSSDTARRQRELPSVTVDRLVRCHRLCVRLKAEGREVASSKELGERLGCSASQVRKDLTWVGKLGRRGSGYWVSDLERVLGRLLGKGRPRKMVLVGAGNLGSALLTYPGFEQRGCRFVAAFDADPDKVGTKLGGLIIQDVSAIPEVLPSSGAEIGVVAVPATGGQWVARVLAENGVRAILNFAPTSMRLGDDVVVGNVDLAIELEKLCYYLTAAKWETIATDEHR